MPTPRIEGAIHETPLPCVGLSRWVKLAWCLVNHHESSGMPVDNDEVFQRKFWRPVLALSPEAPVRPESRPDAVLAIQYDIEAMLDELEDILENSISDKRPRLRYRVAEAYRQEFRDLLNELLQFETWHHEFASTDGGYTPLPRSHDVFRRWLSDYGRNSRVVEAELPEWTLDYSKRYLDLTGRDLCEHLALSELALCVSVCDRLELHQNTYGAAARKILWCHERELLPWRVPYDEYAAADAKFYETFVDRGAIV